MSSRLSSPRLAVFAVLLLLALLLAACGSDSEPDDNNDQPSTPTPAPTEDPFADTDGDGLANVEELNGWSIQVSLNGTGEVTSRQVSSSLERSDSDDDGLTDREERTLRLDPRSRDTDGDGLDDRTEARVYQSNPASVDSDQDARGPEGDQQPNPLLFDGNEIDSFGTSPTLSDTDGDGLTDYHEAITLSQNPLVADVPLIGLEVVGEPEIRLHVTYTENAGTTTDYTARVATDQSVTRSNSSAQTHKASVEIGSEWASEASVGVPPSAKSSYSVSVSAGYSYEHASSWSEESSRSLQNEYEQYQQQARTLTEESASGSIGVALRVRNEGDITFTLVNLVVTVLQVSPDDPTAFRPLATLRLPVDNVTLSPLQPEAGPFNVEASNLDASLIKSLLARPSGLLFEVASFDLVDEHGRNYAFQGAVTVASTGLVVIDYGDGRLERHWIATNVERDPVTGRSSGITLGSVFTDILEIPFITEERMIEGEPSGVTVLTSIRGISTRAEDNAFWVMIGSSDSHADPTVSFEDTVLRSGDQVQLAYVRDEDGDGLYAASEYVFRTSDQNTDTDGDEIGDFEETRQGWRVRTPGAGSGRWVYGDPTRMDTDDDGLPDGAEMAAGTDPAASDTDADGITDPDEIGLSYDPVNPDTDADGAFDGEDHDPLDAQVGRIPPLPSEGLMAFYDGTPSLEDASGNGHAISRSFAEHARDRFGEYESAYYILAEDPGFDEYIAIDGLNINPPNTPREVTLAGWVKWEYSAGPIVSQTGWIKLSINGDNRAVFAVRNGPGPWDYQELVGPEYLDANQWYFVVGVLSHQGDIFRSYLYVDGEQAAAYEWVGDEPLNTWACPMVYLANEGGCRMGGSQNVTILVDDIRIYNRALTSEEILALYLEGDWPPAEEADNS